MSGGPLSLFEGVGIEIEAAVVDAETLDVRPIVDELLREASGRDEWVEDLEDGEIGWSNELVSHVMELKTKDPVPSYSGLSERFLASTRKLNALLKEGWNARLMPTGMHPWMDPARETRLWPHASGEIYTAYDQLFDCRRHGWANVQSVHLNLPFADEDEFGRLLAAARLVLPLVPALAASSPVVEGRATGLLDTRLHYYRTNAERVRAMAGEVIPEPVFGIEPYRDRVLGALDRELGLVGAPPVLRGQEWTNARGAIARFDRMAIEIRLIDTQECALGDLAVAAAVGDLVRGLVEERWASHASQRDCPTAVLTSLLAAALREGPRTVVADRAFAEMFGAGSAGTITMGELWRASLESSFSGPPELEEPLQVIFRRGTLAERILSALGSTFDRERVRMVYGELCDCLAEGRSFVP